MHRTKKRSPMFCRVQFLGVLGAAVFLYALNVHFQSSQRATPASANIASDEPPVKSSKLSESLESSKVAKDGKLLKPKHNTSCSLRKYPAERYYGLNKLEGELPDFLTTGTKYIRGTRPFVISPDSQRTKICFEKPRDPTSTDGLNPSTVFFRDSQFLTVIGDSENGDNQCIYPKPSNIPKGGSKQAWVLLQTSEFVTLEQVRIDLRSSSGNPDSQAKWGKLHLRHLVGKPPPMTDVRLSRSGKRFMVSFYSGKVFGYDRQISQQLYLDLDENSGFKSAYIIAEETELHCCGRNFAFFDVPRDAGLERYFAEWVLPPRFHPIPARVQREANSVPAFAYNNPKIKVHGTSATLVHIPATAELLTLAHVHRPADRKPSDYALHGHHYTHFFVTFDSTSFKVKRISNEFCFAAEGAEDDCDIIQFASGLDFHQQDEKLVISWGVNDCEGAVGLFDWAQVNKRLLPIGASNQDESQVLAELFS